MATKGLSETDAPAHHHPKGVVTRWQVPPEAAGERADVHLSAKVGRLSRARAQQIIKAGDLRSNDAPLKPSTRLARGQSIELWRIAPDDETLEEEPTVLFDDGALLVLDKPGSLAVHPSARYLHQTITGWLRQTHARPDGTRPNPCHRLDRETSGVLLCAHRRQTEAEIKTAFAAGGVRKTYLAIARGRLDGAVEIDAPLALQNDRGLVRIRMIADPDGLPAVTRLRPLAHDPQADRTLVACRPLTGRQHQIRAHLFVAGHPIVGDKLYAMGDVWFDAFTREGVPADGGGLDHARHALHAHCAVLPDDRRFVSPMPAELRGLMPDIDDGAWADLERQAQDA